MATDADVVDTLPDYIKPCLRLFLSVDIVGSTAFKQSEKSGADPSHLSNPVPSWLSAITLFYREIERLFLLKWEANSYKLQNSFDWPQGDSPNLWKAAGDELIYSCILSDHRQALAYVTSWLQTINEFRPSLKKFSNSLDLKCTAWTAGFPVLNSELILKATDKELTKDIDWDDSALANFQLLEKFLRNKDGLIKDFIGPSIDTGFRLTQFSTPRKFVVSVELALLLSHALVTPPEPNFYINDLIKFHFGGKSPLKGVLNGVPYPIFWIDSYLGNNKLHTLEDNFTGSHHIGNSDVREYCLHFIDEVDNDRLIQPYICNCSDSFFHNRPERHTDQLKKYMDYIVDEKNKRELEKQSKTPPTDYPKVSPDQGSKGDFWLQLAESVSAVMKKQQALRQQQANKKDQK